MEKVKREVQVNVWMSRAQRRKLARAAAAAGMSINAFVRARVLSAAADAPIEVAAVSVRARPAA